MYLSIITLNVNGLHALTKRHRVAEWIRKQDPCICCLQETHLRLKDTHRLKVKGWKKIFHANGKKKSWGSSTYSDKIDFKKIEIISSIFSDNAMKLEINHMKNTEKHTKTWKMKTCH